MRATLLCRTVAAAAVAGLFGLGLTACSGDSKEDPTTPAASVTAEEPSEQPADASDADVPEGDLAGFCSAAEKLTDTATFQAAAAEASTDPTKLQAALNDMVAAFDGVTPPAEIADDWATVTAFYSGMSDAVNTIIADPSNVEAMTALTNAMTAATEDSFMLSAMAVGAYGGANCP